MKIAEAQSVLDFWFGSDEPPADEYKKMWFTGGIGTDQTIINMFSELHDRLVSSQLAPTNAISTVAAIILIDQFSRNIYRGKPKAFAWDAMALNWASDGWQKGLFDHLPVSHQLFSLMPLMHCEILEEHDRVDKLFLNLMEKHPSYDLLNGFYSSAQQHRDIIKQFGRYPHRNEVLERDNTAEENVYLSGDAKRFGQ